MTAQLNVEGIKQLQTDLRNTGYYLGNIDGIYGPATTKAYDAFKADYAVSNACGDTKAEADVDTVKIRWGSKVSAVFKARVLWIAKELQLAGGDVVEGASQLMDCMAFEAAESFRPDIRNAAGSSGTGLIQFMSFTAKSLGTTTDKLAAMTAEDQLNFVYKYFAPRKGKLKNLGDIYMAILWPKGIGQPDSYVLWDAKTAPLAYRQNSGLDSNKDNKVTRGEAVVKIMQKTARGKLFMGQYSRESSGTLFYAVNKYIQKDCVKY